MSNPVQSKILVLNNELNKINSSLQNIMIAIEKGIINSTTQSRMQELEQQKEEIEKQIIIENSKHYTEISEKEIKLYFKEALQLKPRLLVNCLIKTVKAYDDKIEVILNSPLKTGPELNQDLFFVISENMSILKPKHRILMVNIWIQYTKCNF